jgi:hypothetical protein
MSLISQMQQFGLWNSFVGQVVEIEPILQAMSQQGLPVSLDRWNDLSSTLKADMSLSLKEMQALVPLSLRRYKTYKKTPTKMTEAHFQADVPCVHTQVKRQTKKREGSTTVYEKATCPFCLGAGVVREWRQWLVWKPSKQSLVAYMKLKGHPVPKDFQGEKDTTGATQLARLFRSTKDPMYEKVLRYRKAQTILTNHMKNWKPGPDGRVHSVYYFDPATGQLSSRRPNVQNAPHHDDPEFGSDYAHRFRGMIQAPEGFQIAEFDMKSAHVQTLAFEAEDADLLRIAKLDVHSFVTAHFLRLPGADRLISLPDDELRDKLKWVKKNYKHDRDAKVKHAFLGYDNGMGYKKLWRQYEEYFESEREAKQCMALFDSLFPKTKRYRDAICLKAHEQGYLISRHGHIRYFYEVFRVKYERVNGRWQDVWSHGEDHEKALSYFTQNDAHCELRDRMRWLESEGIPSSHRMCNTIHDSLMFLWPDGKEIDIQRVHDIMELPSKVLVNSICPQGLSIEVEHKIGPDWASAR